MNPNFSGAEIIQLAISIEEEGVKFYEKYAQLADVELREILLGMAEDERQHVLVFKDMYNQLKVSEEEEIYLFNDSVQDFFSSYAKSEGFNRDHAPIDSVRDALKLAVETERTTIMFYESLIEHARKDVAEILTRLISEETKHQKRLEELL